MKYDILLWDIDGTLMDFKRAEAKALSQSLREVGVVPTEELISEYSQINISYWKRLETGELTKEEVLLGRFVEFLGKKKIKADPKTFLMSYEGHLSHAWFIQDNSLELCRKLKEKGLRQYVVTNGWIDVQKTKLKESGFDKIMDGSFISDELGVPKPKKEFFEACFERVFGSKEPSKSELARVLIIGDSLTSDMKGGVNAGIACCWYRAKGEVNTENISVDYEIEDLWQIWDILEETI
jgi:2-haloacid dehalogenase